MHLQNKNYKDIYLLGILTFLLMFSVTLVYPVLEDFAMERFNVESVAETSLFVSAKLAVYVIFSLIWGSISDRMGGEKYSLLWDFLGNAFLMNSLTLAPTMPLLLILRFIEGNLYGNGVLTAHDLST